MLVNDAINAIPNQPARMFRDAHTHQPSLAWNYAVNDGATAQDGQGQELSHWTTHSLQTTRQRLGGVSADDRRGHL